jgi:hypothetical protein
VGSASWRRWWWVATGVAGLAVGLLALVIEPVRFTDEPPPTADRITLYPREPAYGAPPSLATAVIPGCGRVSFDLTASASPAFAGEPFTIHLLAEAGDDECTVRARLQTVGNGTITTAPTGVLARPAARGAPAEFTWKLVVDTPGPAGATVAILAAENEDVVANFEREVRVEPSNRLRQGTQWLDRRLDDLVVEAATLDGRALRAGQPGTLTVLVRGPAPEPVPSGLSPYAALETCVTIAGAGLREQRCWKSGVDFTGPVAVERQLAVQAERQGIITMTADLSLTGQVDGNPTDPVSASFAPGPIGNATMTIVDQLRNVEQSLLRWLAVAGGVALVAGAVSRLVRRLRNRTRTRSRPAPATRAAAIVASDPPDPPPPTPAEGPEPAT